MSCRADISFASHVGRFSAHQYHHAASDKQTSERLRHLKLSRRYPPTPQRGPRRTHHYTGHTTNHQQQPAHPTAEPGDFHSVRVAHTTLNSRHLSLTLGGAQTAQPTNQRFCPHKSPNVLVDTPPTSGGVHATRTGRGDHPTRRHHKGMAIMIDQFVEGLNKVRKPSLTGYCFLFVWWLYWGADLTTKVPDSTDKPTVPLPREQLCGGATEGRFELDLEQTCRATELWEWAPTSAKLAAVSFVAVMLGGLLDTILSAAWAAAARLRCNPLWIKAEVIDDDISFGAHAAIRVLFASLAVLSASWQVAAAILLACVVMIATAGIRLAIAPTIRKLRLDGQPAAVKAIKLKVIGLAENASPWPASRGESFDFDKERINSFRASDLAHNYPDALASAIVDLKSEYREKHETSHSNNTYGPVFYLVHTEFDEYRPKEVLRVEDRSDHAKDEKHG